jgi:hypothetical protein
MDAFLPSFGSFGQAVSEEKSAQFVPIREQTWPPQATLVSDWLIFNILLI